MRGATWGQNPAIARKSTPQAQRDETDQGDDKTCLPDGGETGRSLGQRRTLAGHRVEARAVAYGTTTNGFCFFVSEIDDEETIRVVLMSFLHAAWLICDGMGKCRRRHHGTTE